MTPGSQEAGASPSLTIQDALQVKNVKEKGEGPTCAYRATLQTELYPSPRGEINKGNQLVGGDSNMHFYYYQFILMHAKVGNHLLIDVKWPWHMI